MNDRRVWVRLGLLLALTVTPASAGAQEREIVLLHTNDFHSAIDPVVAFWMDGEPLIGGAAHIKTMVDSIREREAENGTPVYLFDAGDMFTGLLSRLTYGEILMEMMITMGYDALELGRASWRERV